MYASTRSYLNGSQLLLKTIRFDMPQIGQTKPLVEKNTLGQSWFMVFLLEFERTVRP